jgi:hypothetical protein
MNERIQELVARAYETCENDEDSSTTFPEIFAELIVKDCLSQVAIMGVTNFENDDISWAVDVIIKNIKQHFGVK